MRPDRSWRSAEEQLQDEVSLIDHIGNISIVLLIRWSCRRAAAAFSSLPVWRVSVVRVQTLIVVQSVRSLMILHLLIAL